jgi:hypothetical protein
MSKGEFMDEEARGVIFAVASLAVAVVVLSVVAMFLMVRR